MLVVHVRIKKNRFLREPTILARIPCLDGFHFAECWAKNAVRTSKPQPLSFRIVLREANTHTNTCIKRESVAIDTILTIANMLMRICLNCSRSTFH